MTTADLIEGLGAFFVAETHFLKDFVVTRHAAIKTGKEDGAGGNEGVTETAALTVGRFKEILNILCHSNLTDLSLGELGHFTDVDQGPIHDAASDLARVLIEFFEDVGD